MACALGFWDMFSRRFMAGIYAWTDGALENGVVGLLFTVRTLCEHFLISSGVHVWIFHG